MLPSGLLVQTVVLEGGGGGHPSKPGELQDSAPGDYPQDGAGSAAIHPDAGKSELWTVPVSLEPSGKGHFNTALDPQMVPTLGASAVVMALQVCDQVSLAGFGYDMQHPQSQLHYYEAVPMDAMKAQVGRPHLLIPRPFTHLTPPPLTAGGARHQRRETLSEGPGGRRSHDRPHGSSVTGRIPAAKERSSLCCHGELEDPSKAAIIYQQLPHIRSSLISMFFIDRKVISNSISNK